MKMYFLKLSTVKFMPQMGRKAKPVYIGWLRRRAFRLVDSYFGFKLWFKDLKQTFTFGVKILNK